MQLHRLCLFQLRRKMRYYKRRRVCWFVCACLFTFQKPSEEVRSNGQGILPLIDVRHREDVFLAACTGRWVSPLEWRCHFRLSSDFAVRKVGLLSIQVEKSVLIIQSNDLSWALQFSTFSLLNGIYLIFRPCFCISSVVQCLCVEFWLLLCGFFRLMIDFVADPTEESWKGYFYAVLMLIAATVQTFAQSHYFFVCGRVGLQIRAAIIASVYRKVKKSNNLFYLRNISDRNNSIHFVGFSSLCVCHKSHFFSCLRSCYHSHCSSPVRRKGLVIWEKLSTWCRWTRSDCTISWTTSCSSGRRRCKLPFPSFSCGRSWGWLYSPG